MYEIHATYSPAFVVQDATTKIPSDIASHRNPSVNHIFHHFYSPNDSTSYV